MTGVSEAVQGTGAWSRGCLAGGGTAPSRDAGRPGPLPCGSEEGSESLKKLDVIENPEAGCGG